MAQRSGKRRHHERSHSASPRDQPPKRINTLDIKPSEPRDDDGWQLRASWSDRLFWYHPERKLKQWATPENIRPALWRMCYEKDGTRTICNMETGDRQLNLPQPVPQSQLQAPWDWIEEKGTDGSISWYNPRLAIVSMDVPACLLNAPPQLRCEWLCQQDEKGPYYIHEYTREHVRRTQQQELEAKNQQLTPRVQPSIVADNEKQGKKVIKFDADTLRRNKGNPKFIKAHFVRYQALQQAIEQPSLDGTVRLLSTATDQVLCHLDQEQVALYHHNTHLRQVFINGQALEHAGRMQPSDRVVKMDASGRPGPRLAYQRRQREAKTTEFWYLRSWLIADLEYLLAHSQAGDVVVMELGCPTNYVSMLASSLFPELTFIVFCQGMDMVSLPNVTVHAGPFEQSKLPQLDTNTLFIAHATLTDFPANAVTPPQLQRWRGIIQSLSPRSAMTSFQLPWPGKGRTSSKYFDGELRYPVWGQQTGCECNLVVTDKLSEREWDHKDHEEVMFHFNTKTRVRYYEHRNKAEGTDGCYDCAAETMALEACLRRSGVEEEEDLVHELASYTNTIHSQVSASGRTLANWQDYLLSNMQ